MFTNFCPIASCWPRFQLVFSKKAAAWLKKLGEKEKKRQWELIDSKEKDGWFKTCFLISCTNFLLYCDLDWIDELVDQKLYYRVVGCWTKRQHLRDVCKRLLFHSTDHPQVKRSPTSRDNQKGVTWQACSILTSFLVVCCLCFPGTCRRQNSLLTRPWHRLLLQLIKRCNTFISKQLYISIFYELISFLSFTKYIKILIFTKNIFL